MRSIRKQPPKNDTAAGTRELVTIVRREEPASGRQQVSAFPSDLFEQARGRLRLLAAILFFAFMFDVVVNVITVVVTHALPGNVQSVIVPAVFLAAAVVSAVMWWAAKSPRFSASRIHTMGLVFEVVVCAVSATATYWLTYRET